jgi:hypothetical protein
MTVASQIMMGLLIAIISGILVHVFDGTKKVSQTHCNERRQACNQLVIQRLKSIEEKIDRHLCEHQSCTHNRSIEN